MRCHRLILVMLVSSASLLAHEQCRLFAFKKEDLGKVPTGWKEERTGKGEGSVWRLLEDGTAPSGSGVVLAQMASGPTALFNLCVVEDSRFKDLELTVSFKAVRGQIDQGGGMAWRYQDANNYYIARYNPLESNYRVYKVVDGKRMQLATEEGLRILAGEWHKLTIRHKGDQIECLLDGKLHLKAADSTFRDAGKVGLWTKADAQTHFDGLTVVER